MRSWRAGNSTFGVLAPLLGLVLVAVLVVRPARATYGGTTTNSSSVGAGSVVLTDSDAGSSVVYGPSMHRNQQVTGCITVTYGGTSVDLTPVRLSASVTDPNSFGQYLNLSIEQGAAGASCASFTGTQQFSGTVAGFVAAHSGYANGLSLFTPSALDAQRAYRFTVTLSGTTPESTKGQSVAPVFSWEVHSA